MCIRDRHKDTIAVIKTIEGGPSVEAGLKSGDRILAADGEDLFGKEIESEEIVKKLRGKSGSPVTLSIYRKETSEKLKIKVKRASVPIKSVDAFYMLTDNLGYIKVNRFAESTYREFKYALTLLKKRGATQVALDLRDNPGGYLGIAEPVSYTHLTLPTILRV